MHSAAAEAEGHRSLHPCGTPGVYVCVSVCRALALTIEELRALLALVLGTSDLVLLFTLRALADEQLTADKASLNLQVLRKQVRAPACGTPCIAARANP